MAFENENKSMHAYKNETDTVLMILKMRLRLIRRF